MMSALCYVIVVQPIVIVFSSKRKVIDIYELQYFSHIPFLWLLNYEEYHREHVSMVNWNSVDGCWRISINNIGNIGFNIKKKEKKYRCAFIIVIRYLDRKKYHKIKESLRFVLSYIYMYIYDLWIMYSWVRKKHSVWYGLPWNSACFLRHINFFKLVSKPHCCT